MSLRTHSSVIVAGLFAASLFAPQAYSREPAVRIERLAAFKNGLGFVNAHVPLPAASKSVRLEELPVPVFGTFWMETPENVKVESFRAEMEPVEDLVPASSLLELLLLNTGRRVTVHTGSGKIEGVLESRPAPAPPVSDPGSMRTPHVAPGVVTIRTEDGLVALSPGSISRVDLPGKDAVTVSKSRRDVPVVTATLAQPAQKEKVRLSYLARGFSWAPSYLIDISDAKTAAFRARATILNELADLSDVTLELVTGFPNIRFSDVGDPIDIKQSLSEYLAAVAGEASPWGRSSYGRRPGVLTQQAVLSNAPLRLEAGRAFSAVELASVEGVASEDLFFYPVANFSLKKGARGEVTLFSARLPYRHIYTWSLPETLEEPPSQRGEAEPAEEIWHSCRITNTLNMPLTTAPAEFIKDGRIVGQDISWFTPRGTETTIRINRALNLLAERAEVEVERKRNAETFHGSSYDLVKVRGELRLVSRLSETARVEIKKELAGRVLTMEPPGKDTKTAQGLRRTNPRHSIVWEIDIKPGEEKKIVYVFDLYIRS